MKKPLVSVLMPCYNHSKFIEKSIRSVLNCDYKNIELLIIDDGSQDNSYEIAKKIIENQYILVNYYLIKQENCGVVKTLNKLIKKSNGEYIALLASDDMLTVKGISDRVEYLENNKSIDAVYGNSCLIDKNDKIISLNASKYLYRADEKLLTSKYFKEEMVLRWSAVGPGLLLRKILYNKLGLYDENYCVEDKDFYIKMIAANKIHYLNNTVSMYRLHETNISRNSVSKRFTRIENARINVDKAYLFKNKILYTYLKSYKFDSYLLKMRFDFLYIIYKIFRYSITSIYLYLLKIFIYFNNTNTKQ